MISMIEKLSLAGKQIILVGTAHISSESIELVKKTIEEENPDAVGVELDSQRLEQLKSGSKWRETNVEEILKAGKSHLFLVNLMLSNMQKKFGDSVGIQPGSEMLAAVSAAEEKKIPVELLDRDIKITMKRSLASMGLREKAKLGYSVLEGFFADEKITKEQIEELKKKSFMKYFAWAIPILLLALIGYGFYAKGLDAILRVGATWILVTGGLSAIAVLLARGHILSALTAFVAAPITTIHPALASGWFAALAEAKLNTPKVKDFESLRELKSVGDFFTNRVTKILLVAAFSNLGSMIGVFIALPMVAGVIS